MNKQCDIVLVENPESSNLNDYNLIVIVNDNFLELKNHLIVDIHIIWKIC